MELSPKSPGLHFSVWFAFFEKSAGLADPLDFSAGFTKRYLNIPGIANNFSIWPLGKKAMLAPWEELISKLDYIFNLQCVFYFGLIFLFGLFYIYDDRHKDFDTTKLFLIERNSGIVKIWKCQNPYGDHHIYKKVRIKK